MILVKIAYKNSSLWLRGLLVFIFLTIYCNGNEINSQSVSSSSLTNEVFNQQIHTVRFYRQGNPRSYPIFKMGGKPLVLSFDKFSRDITNYQYTIEHCTPKWESSDLSSQVYLDGMRTAFINNYKQSVNTYHKYTHYNLRFPNQEMKPKITGNYILKVFKNDDPSQKVLTRRFYVAENNINISANLQQANYPEYRDTKQELDFRINYEGLENVSDPFKQFCVVVRQNGRIDNALRNIKPRYVEGKTLIYDYQKENIFNGGNEFRRFDTRSLDFGGQGVRKLVLDSIYTAHLTVDESRAYKTHVNYNDNNGWNLTLAGNVQNPQIEASYISTYFYLQGQPGLKEEENIYVFGGLSDWQIKDKFKLEYLPDKGVYYTNVLLKQGFYDYKYAISKGAASRTINTRRLEGSHHETENQYLILVYFKDPFRNVFKLVGYNNIQDGLSNNN